jgi:agmatinase
MRDGDYSPTRGGAHADGDAEVELAYTGRDTFLKGDGRDVTELEEFDVGVLGVPYDGALSNRPGARYGPRAIRRASAWWAYLSEYKGGLTNVNTRAQVDFSDLRVADCGDVPVLPMDRERTAERIESRVSSIAEQAFPVILGGDHYCTYPSFLGVARTIDADSVGLVQIDAHSDTVTESPVFGEHYHGSSTRLIAESEWCEYDAISQVGIRGYEGPDFFEFVDDVGLSVFTQREVRERGVADVVVDAIEAAAAETDAVYLTFDIDSVDPSVAPGTGTPEPDGLSAHQALKIMEIAGTHPDIAAVDLMEVSPEYDPTMSTQILAASALVTLLERQFAER